MAGIRDEAPHEAKELLPSAEFDHAVSRRVAMLQARNALLPILLPWSAGDTRAAPVPKTRRPAKPISAFRPAGRAIYVEDFGAIGDGVADDRVAIQRAIDAAIATGVGRVRFKAPRYALRHSFRTGTNDLHDNVSGHGLVINGRVTLESAGTRTDLHFLSPNGKSPQRDWQTFMGLVWRGGGIFLRGRAIDPGREKRSGLILRGIYLQGGTTYTGDGSFPANMATGDGWDVTHKGIWAENDYFVGDIALYDSGVIGFRGEMLYQGGLNNGGLTLRNVELAESNANAINPNVAAFVNIDGIVVKNVFQGFEGWGGAHGRMVNAVFENVHNGASRLSGGTMNLDRGAFFYAPKRVDPTRLPLFEVEATFRTCGNVWLGSFLTGRLTLIDTPAYIAPLERGDFTTAIRLRLDMWADAMSLDALTIYGGTPIPHSDITIEIHTHQTDRARAGGFCIQSPVFGNGPLGEGIRIINGTGPIGKWPRPALAGFTGVQPIYHDNRWTLISGNEGTAHQISVSQSTVIAPRSSNIYLIATKPGTFRIGFVAPSPNGYREGTDVTIYCDGAYDARFVFTEGNGYVRQQTQTRIYKGGQRVSFRLTRGVWTEIEHLPS